VEIAEGSTRTGQHLLKLLLLLLAPKAVLLFIIALAIVVPVGVIILVGGVKLLPLGAVSNEVAGITVLKAAPR
jgi:predicted membrane protein